MYRSRAGGRAAVCLAGAVTLAGAVAVIGCGSAANPAAERAAAGSDAALLASALSAAPEAIARHAAVVMPGPDGMRILREGTNGYSCMPDNPDTPGNMPMCADEAGMAWMMALAMGSEPPAGAPISVAYALQGSAFPSIDDPYAEDPPGGAAWTETGPILMLMNVRGMLDGHPRDGRELGAPFVMYAGTPYEHLMIPVRPGS
jgi:hypothetical protein